ncbi:MAG: hypothetical protein PHH08_00200 [Candidatus ainarchaeum sp.]|nr:hypothetical protein [Candidatus ainarchaeum sp.]
MAIRIRKKRIVRIADYFGHNRRKAREPRRKGREGLSPSFPGGKYVGKYRFPNKEGNPWKPDQRPYALGKGKKGRRAAD